MTNPHLKTGVDSTPETLCEKDFRQWIPFNKFMLQIKHHCHKPFELQIIIVFPSCAKMKIFVGVPTREHANIL